MIGMPEWSSVASEPKPVTAEITPATVPTPAAGTAQPAETKPARQAPAAT
jgi:hypothetical protein